MLKQQILYANIVPMFKKVKRQCQNIAVYKPNVFLNDKKISYG